MRTVGESRGWAALALLGAVAVLRPFGCSGQDDAGGLSSELDAAIGELLADVGPEVVLPASERFRTDAAALLDAVEGWHDAVATGGDANGGRASAQAQFVDTMRTWQELEVHQLGPAGSSLTAIGGQDLRDEIYSWPTVNACRVDQETVEQAWDDADYFTANLVNSYGLDALEYLLFAGPGNACPSQVDINENGDWDALGDDGVTANRAAFAAALAADVEARAAELVGAWSPEGDDFSSALAGAGEADSVYDSAQDGLNAVYDALFYLELYTKDRKLAEPLGLSDCSKLCFDEIEGVASGDSVAWIQANLVGFRALFTGGDGAGMDDLLVEAGHGDLAEQMLADTDAAIAAADAIVGPLDAAIEAGGPEPQALYDAVKAVTDALKGDLATVLTLQIPSEAAGDAD